ncbi:GNAT family N-acetyltransferase [Streptomyces sp. NPDC092296]|uniref:GNAT family N-acetyltransferase n=1 Tax=Streptomyces sp. NPDC092296 TaxID=3366012 RepID=UPI00382A2FE3
MDQRAVLAEYDQRMRKGAVADGPGARVERLGGVVRQIGTEQGWSGVLWSGLDWDTADGDTANGDTADAAIAEQIRYFTSLGREFEWKLYSHDRPTDLGERLRAAGFTSEPAETLMVAQVSELPTDAELPDGLRLRPVVDAAGVDLVADVHEQVFGGGRPQLRQRLLTQLTDAPDMVAVVVVMAGELPVCAARLELYPGTGFAGLWGGGTLPDWRGRGIYRALVAHRAKLAAERGYRYLQVDASDQSSPILRRLGFLPLSTTTPYLYRPHT